MIKRGGIGLLSAAALWALTPAVAAAIPQLQRGEPVYFQAEAMGYDTTNHIVHAKGHVEVYQGEYILLADRIRYLQDENKVYAEGHVSLLEPGGTVYFADNLELKDNMKEGVVREFRIRLADNSLFAAREARKINEDTTELHRAVYSPCKICRDEEGKPKAPLWQIKANKVLIDERAQKVTYRNARMEVYGVPVIYSPYLSHPTPGADRKSGFLLPEYSQSSTLGTTVKAPYYINIAPDKDATVTPWVTAEEGVVLEGQYRQLTDKGNFQFDGSVTNPRERDDLGLQTDGHELRGHIFARGNAALPHHWGWGFDLNRATDDTYLRRYRFGNQDTLTSRLYAEHVKRRDHVLVQGVTFQGLEIDDDPDRTPLIVPSLDASTETGPMWHGSRARISTRSLVLSRQLGADSRRISTTAGWKVPHVTPGGHVLEADAAIRADYYSLSDVERSDGDRFSGTETRLIPQLTLAWRYPMIRQLKTGSVTIEPRAELIASSNGNNPDVIPNEDSLVPEFSDVTLFSRERFPGADRVENGTRLVYALHGQWDMKPGQHIRGLIGQNYHLDGDQVYPITSDPEDEISDVVGAVGVAIDPLDLSYRVNVDPHEGDFRRNEIRAAYGDARFSGHLDYVRIEDDPFLLDAEEAIASGALKLDEQWTLIASGNRDLERGKAVTALGGLTWQNECVTILSSVRRDYIRDRDIEPDTSFSVRVALRNLN